MLTRSVSLQSFAKFSSLLNAFGNVWTCLDQEGNAQMLVNAPILPGGRLPLQTWRTMTGSAGRAASFWSSPGATSRRVLQGSKFCRRGNACKHRLYAGSTNMRRRSGLFACRQFLFYDAWQCHLESLRLSPLFRMPVVGDGIQVQF